jgi:hypothetical protein
MLVGDRNAYLFSQEAVVILCRFSMLHISDAPLA